MDPELRSLVTPHTGDIHAAKPVDAGYRGGVKLTVRAARGSFFVKAWPDDPAARDPREVALNPHLTGVAPALVAYARNRSWMVLIHEHVNGRHCDLSPGSSDVPLAVAVVGAVSRITLTANPAWPQRTWRNFAEPDEAARIGGDVLLHSDINPDNILITADGTATLVDWGSPTLGHPAVNLTDLATQLIAAGHAPEQADALVSDHPAWHDAAVLDTVATVTLRMHRAWERDRPGWTEKFPPGTWLRAISPAVERWAQYRGVHA